jgi:hypothetical protein
MMDWHTIRATLRDAEFIAKRLDRAGSALRDACLSVGRHPTTRSEFDHIEQWFGDTKPSGVDLDLLSDLADALEEAFFVAGFKRWFPESDDDDPGVAENVAEEKTDEELTRNQEGWKP